MPVAVSTLSAKGGLETNKTYRVSFNYNGMTGRFNAEMKSLADRAIVGQVNGTVPKLARQFQVDEVGAAMWDADETSTILEKAYRYRLERVTLRRK